MRIPSSLVATLTVSLAALGPLVPSAAAQSRQRLPLDSLFQRPPPRPPDCFRVSLDASPEDLATLEGAGFRSGSILQWIPEPRRWRSLGLEPPRQMPRMPAWAFWWPASADSDELIVWWPVEDGTVRLRLAVQGDLLQGAGTLTGAQEGAETLEFPAAAAPVRCPGISP